MKNAESACLQLSEELSEQEDKIEKTKDLQNNSEKHYDQISRDIIDIQSQAKTIQQSIDTLSFQLDTAKEQAERSNNEKMDIEMTIQHISDEILTDVDRINEKNSLERQKKLEELARQEVEREYAREQYTNSYPSQVLEKLAIKELQEEVRSQGRDFSPSSNENDKLEELTDVAINQVVNDTQQIAGHALRRIVEISTGAKRSIWSSIGENYNDLKKLAHDVNHLTDTLSEDLDGFHELQP